MALEKETCGRCGGSGRYSYCQTMTGPFGAYTCFRCSGRKQHLTKRAAIASHLLRESRLVPVESLEPGDRIRKRGDNWATVKAVYMGTDEHYSAATLNADGTRTHVMHVETDKMTYVGCNTFEKPARDKAHMAYRLELAEQYQNLLTKAGKVRKGKEAEAESVKSEIYASMGNVPAVA